MKNRLILIASLCLLLLGPGGTNGWADQPNCGTAPPLAPGTLTVWPVRERLAGDVPGGTRNSLMSSFGEFQGHYVHTGIDIRGVWNNATSKGDLVLAVADGDIWAAPKFSGDFCDDANLCRLYVKSKDRRHIYYYSHLSVRSGADSEVRARIESAAMKNPADDLPVGSNPVTAGQKLAGLSPFPNEFIHLHFGIFDACENYDGLNPLALLPAPDFQGSPYVDETDPTIPQFVFLRDGTQNVVDAEGCTKPLSGAVDLLVEAKEVYHDLTAGTPPFKATNSMGVHRGSYRIRRTPSGAPYDGTWYEFDRGPYRCRGAQRGKSCTDPVNGTLLTQTDFIQKVALLPPFGDGGAELGVTYTDNLFNDVAGMFNSDDSYSGTEKYFHLLTNEWGYTDQPGKWDSAAIPNGRYQVSVEVADVRGNKAARHKFVLVDNGGPPPSATGDLVIRDNPSDGGAVPSTLGGERFWISPDIRITKAGDPAPANWDSPQEGTVLEGQSYSVWVRVKNTGCETLHNVRAKVAWANPAMIQTDWSQIGAETPAGVSLNLNEAKVLGPFNWIPTAEQVGHRCLLAITRANEDTATVPNFDTIADGWGGTVANDNNIGQLNLQVTGVKKFMIFNPDVDEAGVGIDFDCNDFPLREQGAVAELSADFHPALEAAWTRVPRTALRREGNQLIVRFQGCKVTLPPARLPGGTVIPAFFDLQLAPGPAGSHRVDLGQTLDGELAGGMSFRIDRLPVIQ